MASVTVQVEANADDGDRYWNSDINDLTFSNSKLKQLIGQNI